MVENRWGSGASWGRLVGHSADFDGSGPIGCMSYVVLSLPHTRDPASVLRELPSGASCCVVTYQTLAAKIS